MSTITIPSIGCKVRAKYIPSVTNGTDLDHDKFFLDQVVTVKNVEERHSHRTRTGENVIAPALYAIFDTTSGGKQQYFFTEWEVVTDETPVEETAADPKDAKIASLEEQLRLSREQTAKVRTDGHSAMGVIARRINEEAEDRGWCEQFDKIIDEINSEISQYGYELEKREREFEITVTAYVTVTQTVTVTAQDSESACELAEGMVDLADAFTYGNYDVTDIECEEY